MNVPETLLDLADGFDHALRSGGTEDRPEGSRFIQISDTAACRIAEELRQVRLEYIRVRAGQK